MKYFIGVGITVILLVFWISFVFYKSFWKETFNFQKLPQEYTNYTALIDTITDDFTITHLGRDGLNLFKDNEGDFLVSILYKPHENDTHEILYKIGKDGSILDSLMLPKRVYLHNGHYSVDTDSSESVEYEPFIIGSNGYITWLDDGDKTFKQFKEIDTEKELDEYLSKSEIISIITYARTIAMCRDGVWYKARIEEDEDDEDYRYKKIKSYKEKFIPTTNLRIIDTLALGNYEYPSFSGYPGSEGNLKFMFFEKDHYIGSSFLGGLGSPTGGSRGNYWVGAGYFNLQFPNSVFKFYTYMEMSDREDPDYSTSVKILQDENFAIIGLYGASLVKMNNNK